MTPEELAQCVGYWEFRDRLRVAVDRIGTWPLPAGSYLGLGVSLVVQLANIVTVLASVFA